MVTGSRLRALLLASCLIWQPLTVIAQDRSLIAEVDRATVRVNESFTYTLRAEGQLSGRPDLSALGQDFDLLDTFRSTNVQIVNGEITQIGEWVVALMPRQTGTFELPAVELDGVRSNTVSVEVLPASAANAASDDIFMEVEVDRTTAYVQAEIIYTLKLYVAAGVGTGPATLTAPQTDGGEAIIEKLGSDREYQTNRGGKRFNVRERRYAIFAQAPGTLSIGPVVYESVVQQRIGFARTFRLPSDVIGVEVKPAVAPPPQYPNAVWLPASKLTLNVSWSGSGTEFVQGVPQTRTVTISAEGLLETQLPEISFETAAGLRQYADQPELGREVTADGIIATRTERQAVIAQQAGDLELPAVELPWWNVDQERWEIARLEPRSIAVRADGAAVAPPASPVETFEVQVVETNPGWWLWISAGLGAGWLATLAAWLFSSRRGGRAAPAPRAEKPLSNRQLIRQLVAACRVDDARRTQKLLLDWVERQFPDDPPKSLGGLAGRLSGPLAVELEGLEAALYGRKASEWRGQRLAELLQSTQTVLRRGDDDDEDPLLPLYR